MHDNAKPHTAKLTKQWLDNNTPDYIRDWPAISPDLNPIENLWAIVDNKVHEKKLKTVGSLKKRIKKVITELAPETVNNTINSLPERIKRCIKAKGGDFLV